MEFKLKKIQFQLAAILRLSLGDGILRNDFDGPAPDGAYRWAFQTGKHRKYTKHEYLPFV